MNGKPDLTKAEKAVLRILLQNVPLTYQEIENKVGGEIIPGPALLGLKDKGMLVFMNGKYHTTTNAIKAFVIDDGRATTVLTLLGNDHEWQAETMAEEIKGEAPYFTPDQVAQFRKQHGGEPVEYEVVIMVKRKEKEV